MHHLYKTCIFLLLDRPLQALAVHQLPRDSLLFLFFLEDAAHAVAEVELDSRLHSDHGL